MLDMKKKKFLGFSLVEIMVSIIVLSVVTAAFVPVITKRASKGIKITQGASFSCPASMPSECTMCVKDRCVLCNANCSTNQFRDDAKCTCAACTTKFANCLKCKIDKCLECEETHYVEDGKCVICPAGYKCNGIKKIPCPAGSYTSTTGNTGCLICPSGHVATGSANTNCTICANGTYANDNHTACSDCNQAHYCTGGIMHGCELIAINAYQPNKKQSTCLICPPGNYTPDRKSCTLCPPDYYCDGTKKTLCPDGTVANADGGATACIQANCKDGYSAVDSSSYGSTCKPCPAGTYSNSSTHHICTPCPPGTRSDNLTAATSCVDCDEDSYSPGGTTQCTSVCVLGLVNKTKKATACISCRQGEYIYTDANGVRSCKTCPAGTFSWGGNNDKCQVCPEGYETTPDKSNCTPCTAGFFRVDLSKAECTKCPPGTYSDYGAKACIPCPIGTYNPNYGAASCKQCSGGKYANTTGSISCKECDAGTYSYTGWSTCIKCYPGTYQPNEGQSGCIQCPMGRFSNIDDTPGLTECKLCPRGTYADGTGSFRCTPCPDSKPYTAYRDRTTADACTNVRPSNWLGAGFEDDGKR